MPDNGSGTYSLPPGYKVTNGDVTDASQHNPPFEDIAQALTLRLSRDGRSAWTGNQNANSNKITNLADPTGDQDAVNKRSVMTLVNAEFAALDPKETPVNGDGFLIIDSEDSDEFKTLDYEDLEDTLESHFDTLYAAQSQTDFISGVIAGSLTERDWRLVINLPYAITITKVTTRSVSGTCTATFKINSTALGGTANSVSSSEQSQAHASNNEASAGDDIVVTISSNSSCTDMSFTIEFTRTLA